MSAQGALRDLQDRVRDAGWRIKWIPWQGAGKVEIVYNTPLTLLTGLGGAAVFVYSMWAVVAHRAPLAFVGVGFLGLLVAVAGRLYAARVEQREFIAVQAVCDDREIQNITSRRQGHDTNSWEFRLSCSFTYQGKSYRVTPASPRIAAFTSERAATDYLKDRIDADGKCRLMINPRNPLHAVFHEKAVIK